MNIPEKIYIPIYPNYDLEGYHLSDDWMFEPQKNQINAEYIHKDTILNWIKEHEINAEIIKDINNKLHVKSYDDLNPDDYKFGEEVKIIIIKE